MQVYPGATDNWGGSRKSALGTGRWDQG